MGKFRYVVDLIQEIHDDELAIAKKRELLDSTWQALLAEDPPPPAVLHANLPLAPQNAETVHFPNEAVRRLKP